MDGAFVGFRDVDGSARNEAAALVRNRAADAADGDGLPID